MNDLQRYFPNTQLQNLMDDLAINSWDEFARRFLLGDGKSKRTYESYLASSKQFYDFTGGLHPMQAGTPEWIEQFYDSLTGAQNSKALAISGLKYLYKKVGERFPYYVSPFDVMNEKLTKKLNKTKKSGTKAALTQNELNRLLSWLKERTDPKGKLAYSAIYMLSTTGLRATELCNLRWSDIEERDGVRYAHGIGKGDKPFCQEVFEPALRTIKHKGEYLFYRLRDERPLNAHGLWDIVRAIGEQAREAGIIAENRKVTFSPHLFRRTYCTLLSKAGMDIKALSELSRHSSVETLAKHYLDTTEAAAPYLNKIFGTV